jgi:hypothetical protein
MDALDGAAAFAATGGFMRVPRGAKSGRAVRQAPASLRLPAVLYAMVVTPFGAAMAVMIAPVPVAAVVHATLIVSASIVAMIGIAIVVHVLRDSRRGGDADARHAQRDDDRFEDLHAASSPARESGLWRGERISQHLVPDAARHLIFARAVPGAGAVGLASILVLTAALGGVAAGGFGRVSGDRVQFGLLLGIGLSDRTAMASGKREQGGDGCGGADHCGVPMTHDGRGINAREADRPTRTT